MERLVDLDDKGIAHMLLEEDTRKESHGTNQKMKNLGRCEDDYKKQKSEIRKGKEQDF